jgi:hypothetical protein
MCKIISIRKYKNHIYTNKNYLANIKQITSKDKSIYLSNLINTILEMERKIGNAQHITFIIRACRYVDKSKTIYRNSIALMRQKSNDADINIDLKNNDVKNNIDSKIEKIDDAWDD